MAGEAIEDKRKVKTTHQVAVALAVSRLILVCISPAEICMNVSAVKWEEQ